MANITIRNLDDAVVERLRAKAKLNDRSLEAELRLLLGQAARSIDGVEFSNITAHIRQMMTTSAATDTTALLRGHRMG